MGHITEVASIYNGLKPLSKYKPENWDKLPIPEKTHSKNEAATKLLCCWGILTFA